MSIYSLHDAQGRVFIVLSLQQRDQIDLIARLNAATGYVDGDVDGRAYYVLDGVVMPRLESPVVLDRGVLRGLPLPCLITINETEYPCDTETVELEFDQPGSYRVSVQAWPYLDKEFTIENPA